MRVGLTGHQNHECNTPPCCFGHSHSSSVHVTMFKRWPIPNTPFSTLEGFLCSGPCHVGGWVRTPSLGGDMDLSSRGYGPVGGGYRPDPFTVPSVQKTGFSRSGSGTCSGNTWGTRHVPCSLFPVPLRIPPLKKRFILLRPCCAFASLDSDLFPVPCSLFPEDPTERTCVPCSLFPYSLRENPSLQKTVEGSGLYP